MWIKRLVVAATLILTLAGAASAQTIDWRSPSNQTWWNALTQAELQELVAESGGVWRDRPDGDDRRLSYIDWPDLPAVTVREYGCQPVEVPMSERSCTALQLYLPIESLEAAGQRYVDGNRGYLMLGMANGAPAFSRLEFHNLGTTRGHVLSLLVFFRLFARENLDLLDPQ